MDNCRQWNAADLDDLEQRYRANLVNSLSGFKSANLIGTVDTRGVDNVAIVSSVVHLGANPPLIAFINRPDSVERHTLDNLAATGWFTVNQVNVDCWERAHQTSARYPREASEFEEVGLTPEFSSGCPAPYVAESRLRFACQVVERQRLAVNGTVMVIGRIVELQIADGAVGEDGYVDIEALGTVAVSGLDSYHRTTRLGRLSYAKPDQPPRRID
ncbi:flavin reductase family protein [Microbulbifer flavimaris]|uniref:Flavin reductase family protein n=1 Tax=Microbulbifer flavimaris TaxID=1781068 RepID=A0ABX4HYT3_9GAMM|nr:MULTISPECIES: flavin reductase family protein [Microbulbifer]KUJ83051.1 flavin oxidoreductase [Microbulbifer sp. ZGT114]PCO05236.1 flavin reductase family protein [Microbulbifer flavimaris]